MTIRLTKLRDILILTFLVWIAIFITASTIMVRLRESDVKELLSSRLLDCMEFLHYTKETKDAIYTIAEAEEMSKCRALTYLLELRKGKNIDQKTLDEIAKSMFIREYTVTNEKGIVEYTNVKESMGYDISSSEQSREFLPALMNPDFEYIQSARPRSDGKKYKYIGKARRDQRGLVQIVCNTDDIRKIHELENIEQRMQLMRIGSDGFVFIARKNEIIAAENPEMVGTNLKDYGVNALPQEGEFFDFYINGTAYLASFEKFEQYQLIGVISKSDIYDVARVCIYTSIIETVIGILFVWMLFSKLQMRQRGKRRKG